MARTTASASIVSLPTLTPRAAPSRWAISSTTPMRSVAPRAVGPVEGQEAARLPRRGAGHARALDHGDRDAAPREEVRHRGAHHAGATDDDTTRRAHGRLPAVSWPSSSTRTTT